MRAMHVDAFFEYCLGHPHNYYIRLPSASGPASESRDGVPLEEDLALRALVPEWKPKRGRKRAEDKESEDGQAAKRPQLDTSVGLLDSNPLATHAANFPPSAIPFSAFPDDMDTTDPWAAAASSFASDGQGVDPLGGQELRWRSLDRDASPAGYPRSAIIPRHHNPADMLGTSEPRSAVTPSSRERSRTRRRHGPAVSSAWPSSSGSVTGRMRGRPPNRGSALGGPFSSFPANPARSNTPADNASMRSSPAVTADNQIGPQNNQSGSNQTHNTQTPEPGRPFTRPSKLQLQVPDNPGRPIRLATPPTLLVNGTDQIPGFPPNGHESTGSNDAASDRPAGRPSLEDVTRMLAGRILHANVIGRAAPIEGDEAGALARAVVDRFRGMYSGVPLDLVSIACAIFGVGVGPQPSLTVKVDAATAEDNSSLGQPAGRSTRTYTLTVDNRSAGVSFNHVLSELSLENGASKQEDVDALKDGTADEAEADLDIALTDDELNNSTDLGNDATWKQRYQRLRQTMQKKEAALREYKRNILQAVMADI